MKNTLSSKIIALLLTFSMLSTFGCTEKNRAVKHNDSEEATYITETTVTETETAAAEPVVVPEDRPMSYEYNSHILMPQYSEPLTEEQRSAALRIIDAVESHTETVCTPEIKDFDRYLEVRYLTMMSCPLYGLVEDNFFSDGVITLTFKYDAAEHQRLVDAWKKEVENVIGANCFENESEAEKVCNLYRYVANHIHYNYEALDNPDIASELNTYTALINSDGICKDYSNLFTFLLQQCGIECYGVEDLEHAWNLVKLDGNYYHMDTTYESTSMQDSEETSYCMYFGMSDASRRESRDYEWYIRYGQDFELTKECPECPNDYEQKWD